MTRLKTSPPFKHMLLEMTEISQQKVKITSQISGISAQQISSGVHDLEITIFPSHDTWKMVKCSLQKNSVLLRGPTTIVWRRGLWQGLVLRHHDINLVPDWRKKKSLPNCLTTGSPA